MIHRVFNTALVPGSTCLRAKNNVVYQWQPLAVPPPDERGGLAHNLPRPTTLMISKRAEPCGAKILPFPI